MYEPHLMSPRHNFGSRKIENSLSEKRTVGGFENFGGSSRNIFEMYWNRLCFYFSKIKGGRLIFPLTPTGSDGPGEKAQNLWG